MSETPPVRMTWDGEAFVPETQYQAKLCDRYFVVGERYQLVEHHDRSSRSHRHFFACVNEAWQNLPEDLAERFPTSEHLRKYALIRAGYRDERSIVAASKAEAQRMASFVKPMDEYAVVTVSEAVVTVYTAKSQSTRAMGKKTFQESKEAVLDVLAALIHVDRDTLERQAA